MANAYICDACGEFYKEYKPLYILKANYGFENGYKAICTLSSRESKKCLLNNKCKFEANQLYLMSKQDLIDIQNKAHLKGEEE